MARKTMAERYAAQRSGKATRRRALPRLSDAAETLDPQAPARDGEGEGEMDGLYDVRVIRPSGGPLITGATGTRSRAAAMPRRTGLASGRAGVAAAATSVVNYAYVRRDLQRIAIIAVAMLVLLIVLNVILQAVIR